MQLMVYDGVIRPGSALLGATAMTCSAPLVMGIGVIVFIIGLFQRAGKKN